MSFFPRDALIAVLRTTKRRRYFFRRLPVYAIATLILPSVLPTGESLASEWPTKAVTIIVPTPAGGSLDRMARITAPYLGDELDAIFVVENRPGGLVLVGHDLLLRRPNDGYTMIMTPATPYLLWHVLLGRAGFTMDDFAYINNQWGDWSALVVPEDKPYRSLPELIEAIRSRPGKLIQAGALGTASDELFEAALDRLGIPDGAVKQVTYQGGGPIRVALMGSHVDFAIVSAEGSYPIKDHIRSLAVFRNEPQNGWEGPPINDILKVEYGFTIPIVEDHIRTMATSAEFRRKYPERWAKLVAANRRMLERPEVREAFDNARIGVAWVGPEKTELQIRHVERVIAPYLRDGPDRD